MTLTNHEIHQLLNEKYDQFNRSSFIESDPISIPHLFTKKEDIEIAGFISATIAWGQRKTIIKNANSFVESMDMEPFDFVMNHNQKELKRFADFKHRTFNGIDAQYFITALKNIYTKHNGLENVFAQHPNNMQQSIANFKRIFFEINHPQRTQKHISDPLKNSAAKRINMYLRWMVRNDKRGVDFGLWNKIATKNLMCPLDVHSGNVARKLGILKRTQDDWKATVELTESLKQFDNNDPVKYDFSLFGLGVFEKF
ncbi:MAG: TIGR02757 family protein [Flavobacteriales bacterium]|nr:TIGR02757 family protein [Flavobacteriales bacterium]MCB9364140.1 TIGR02757 family protein [Flavobacteriales bacterium]